MLRLPAGKLRLPTICYAQKVTRTVDADEASWNLAPDPGSAGLRFLASASKQEVKYSILVSPGLVASDTVEKYQRAFEQHIARYAVFDAKHQGNILVSSSWNQIKDMAHNDLQKMLRVAIAAHVKANGGQMDLLLLILPQKHIGIYSAFKSIMDQFGGVKSICLTEKKNLVRQTPETNPPIMICRDPSEDRFAQYMANVMMKANLKLGGTNHTACTNVRQEGPLSDIMQNTLVLGA